ncbi:MIP/aquaporin family protein [Telmatobacter bradus]|uniref:MIP/aquaporin family protein n=1 Tax=Telmatobacter bradus TaxID=474953 RepID=UPI003B43AC4F
MHSVWLGEFMGTLILLLLGGGVNAGVTLRKSFAQGAGWLVVALGWALAVLCGVLTAQAFGSSGAHLNPAVSLAAAIVSGDYAQLLSYWSAQLLGAMAGAVLVAVHYGPHWKETPEAAAKLGIFATRPAIHAPCWNLLSEIFGTAVLIVVVNAINSRGVSPTGPAPGFAPWLVACLVWSVGLSLGGTTGYAINPTRDLGPRIVHALLPIPGKGPSNWSYAPIPVFGPLIGAVLGGLLVRWARF